MTTIEQILGIIVTNRDINPRKKYDDKCFKSPEAFYHHLVMSIETPCTGNIQTYGVKDSIKNALNSVRNRNDFSELFEVAAEIKAIYSPEEAGKHFEHILEKLIKYKVVTKCRIGLLFARYVPSNNSLTQHDVYEVVHKHLAGKTDQDGGVWDEIVDELWHNYGTGYEELIDHLNPEYTDAVSFKDIKNNVKALTHQLYRWERNVLAGDDPFIPEMNNVLLESDIKFVNNEDYAELVRLGSMSRNALMSHYGFTQLQLAPYITASMESRLKFLYEHVLLKRERKNIAIATACDQVMNYLTYTLSGDTDSDINECLKIVEDITSEEFRIKMADCKYVSAPEGTSKIGVIKMGIAKMSKQTQKNDITLVTNRSILSGMRPRFNILDNEFDLLSTIVSMPVETLVELGIFTQGIVNKILAGGSDHQRVHLTHREIDFGIGYPKAMSLVYTPTSAVVTKPITVDPSINYADTNMDHSALQFGIKLDPVDQKVVSISDLAKKTLEKEKDKELVLKSFITFVKEELSENHDSDVQTGLEILQDYFTVEELFAKLTGCELPVGHQFLGWKNVSGISLKELVSHTITISRKCQAVYKEMAELNRGVIHIAFDKDDVRSDVREIRKQWLTQNCFPVSLTQEALKTKRPDHELGDESHVIRVKLVDNVNWGKMVQGLIKIFDERIKEQQAKAEETFSVVLNQIRSGEISYEKVKEVLTIPNIHAKNKYDDKYVIRALGGIPAVKEAIGITLEDMDEREHAAILKFQIAMYQQAAGTFNSRYNQMRSRIGEHLNNLWKEAVAYHAQTGTPGISRHYKDSDLEMRVVCCLNHDNFGFPMWKTKVEVVRSKHFAAGKAVSFSGLQFHSDEQYREQVLMKLFRV